MVLLSLIACGNVCGAGTQAVDGVCVRSPFQNDIDPVVWDGPEATAMAVPLHHEFESIALPLEGRPGPEPLTSWSLGVGPWTLTRDLVSTGDDWVPWDGRLRVTDGRSNVVVSLWTAAPGAAPPIHAPVRGGDSWYVVVESEADLGGKFAHASAVLVRLPDRGLPTVTEFNAFELDVGDWTTRRPVIGDEGLVGWLRLRAPSWGEPLELPGCSIEGEEVWAHSVLEAALCSDPEGGICEPIGTFIGVEPWEPQSHYAEPLESVIWELNWLADCAAAR